MQNQMTARLETILSDVLASLAFMFTDEDADAAPSAAPWLETSIRYEGPSCGRLRLRCARDFATRLAANLLSVEPEADDLERAGNDAVKEFMNIVCGQFITAVHGVEDVYSITIPEMTEIADLPETFALDKEDWCRMRADGHLLQLSHDSADLLGRPAS